MSTRSVSFLIGGAAGTATLTAASAPSPLYPVYQRLFGFSAFTLTFVFAVYVFALLLALLTVGSLSDRVGRRPVASAALLLLAVGMLLFATAGGTTGLVVARVVQGLAVGAATGTTTAMIMDAAPDPRTGSTVSSAVPSLGIAVGAVLSGTLVQYAPHPRQLVFWLLAFAFAALAGLVWLVPERGRTHGEADASLWRSLLPSVGVPPVMRGLFVTLLPSIAATWALGGLYLSLGSSILRTVLGVDNQSTVGLVLALFFAAGAAGPVASEALPDDRREWVSYTALGAGVLVTIVAMHESVLPLYALGSVIAGLGFGATFRLAVSAIGQAAPDEARGEVFAAMYIVSYLAFSVPALVAGLAVGRFGLEPTAMTYGAFEVVLVAMAGAATAVRARRRDESTGENCTRA